MSKSFLAVLASIIILFVGIGVYNTRSSSDKQSGSSALSQHVIGNPNAKVTIVEYGDYQCPYCQQYSNTFKLAIQKYNDKVKFQFRNFPLSSLHPNAVAAARASEASSLQGKFWEMHDMLYDSTNWAVWTKASDPIPLFNDYAKQLGLNVAQFKNDFTSEKVNNTINADKAEGSRLGVQGTPAFFVNGNEEKIDNTLAGFEKIINKYLSKQN